MTGWDVHLSGGGGLGRSEVRGTDPGCQGQLWHRQSGRVHGGSGRSVEHGERHRTRGALKNEETPGTKGQSWGTLGSRSQRSF